MRAFRFTAVARTQFADARMSKVPTRVLGPRQQVPDPMHADQRYVSCFRCYGNCYQKRAML